jgi:hypothetical protein
MKRFRVVYVPKGKEDKEWTFVGAKSADRVLETFNMGIIVSIVEEPFED